MGYLRDALLRLVRAWMNTNKMLDAYVKAGLDNNALFQVCGEIGEAICILIGEADADWEESKTYITLTAPYLTEERRVEMLMGVYEQNVMQPAPRLFTREEMMENVKKNGGYMQEWVDRKSPEGGWA